MKKNKKPQSSLTKKKRTCLLVLGMHRSGTSAFTRILSIAGAKLPATLMGAATGNEVGHWESLRLARYHDSILAELDSTWSDWRELEISGLPVKRREEIKTEIQDIIALEFGDAPLFIVKDPRICRFPAIFIEALEENGIDVRIVLPFRNPLEVCESLERRDGMAQADAVLLWLRHVLDAEYASRTQARVILSIDGWLSGWRSTLKSLKNRFNIKWPYKLDEIAPQIDSFVNPDLRHHKRSTEEVLLDPMMRNWIGETYQALQVLTRNPDSKTARKKLDSIRMLFNTAEPVLHELQSVAAQKSKALTEEIAGRDKSLSENAEAMKDLNERLQQAQGEASQLEASLFQRNYEVAEIKETLSQAEARSDEQIADLKKTSEEEKTVLTCLLEEKTEELSLNKEELSLRKDEIALIKETVSQTETLAEEQITALKKANDEEKSAQANSYQEKNNVLNQSLAESQDKAKRAEEKLQRMHGSVSWKATLPLRLAGRAMSILPNKERKRLRRDMKLIRDSGFFDADYYRRNNPDLTEGSAPDPLLHYLKYGGMEGRAASAGFDSRWYLEQNPDVRREGINPLLHYLRDGKREGRTKRSSGGHDQNGRQDPLRGGGLAPFTHNILRQESMEDLQLRMERAGERNQITSRIRSLEPNQIFQKSIPTTRLGHSSTNGNSNKNSINLSAGIANANIAKITRVRRAITRRSICFISATHRNDRPLLDPSVRYRCFHLAEALVAQGHMISVVSLKTFLEQPDSSFDTYVFHRPSVVERNFDSIIGKLKSEGKILVAEYDDLIFGDAEIAAQSSIVKNKVRDLKYVERAFKHNLDALQYFDKVSVSTRPLAAMVSRYNPHAEVMVVPNSIPHTLLGLVGVTRPYMIERDQHSIGYFCGTRSHDKDFTVVDHVIQDLLEEDRKLKLQIVGPLEVPVSYRNHPRVSLHPVVDYWRLPFLMTQCHTVIAPLEDSLFNNCKSRVKFLEALMAGSTLVATPIDDMTRVDKSYLHLARSEDDWRSALKTAVDEGYSQEKAASGFKYLMRECSTSALVSDFIAFLER